MDRESAAELLELLRRDPPPVAELVEFAESRALPAHPPPIEVLRLEREPTDADGRAAFASAALRDAFAGDASKLTKGQLWELGVMSGALSGDQPDLLKPQLLQQLKSVAAALEDEAAMVREAAAEAEPGSPLASYGEALGARAPAPAAASGPTVPHPDARPTPPPSVVASSPDAGASKRGRSAPEPGPPRPAVPASVLATPGQGHSESAYRAPQLDYSTVAVPAGAVPSKPARVPSSAAAPAVPQGRVPYALAQTEAALHLIEQWGLALPEGDSRRALLVGGVADTRDWAARVREAMSG